MDIQRNEEDKEFAMIVASSSKYVNGGEAKKQLPIQYEEEELFEKGPPLPGIKEDIQKFISNFRFRQNTKNYTVYQSSAHQNILLSKEYILNIIRKDILQHKCKHNILFYTGHGHKNGNWAVQTKQIQQGDSIKLLDIIEIWKQIFPQLPQDSYLFIIMDSCYSGNWCYELALNSSSRYNISVIASSDRKQPSYCSRGGLFFKSILGKNETEKAYSSMIEKSQNPLFSYCGNPPVYLSLEALKNIKENIQNVYNLKNTFFPSCIPYQQLKNGLILVTMCKNPFCEQNNLNKIYSTQHFPEKFEVMREIYEVICPKCKKQCEKAEVKYINSKIKFTGRIDENGEIVQYQNEERDHRLCPLDLKGYQLSDFAYIYLSVCERK